MEVKCLDYKWLDLKKFDVRSFKWVLEIMKEMYIELNVDYFFIFLKFIFIY